MHLSNMAICLMDSDKAIGGLYLDADDFLHTGFLCHSYSCLSGKREESSLQFLQTDSQSPLLSSCMWDWLPVFRTSQPSSTHAISPSLCINSPLIQQKENKVSLCWAVPCVWRHMVMVVMKMERVDWEILTGLKNCVYVSLDPAMSHSKA